MTITAGDNQPSAHYWARLITQDRRLTPTSKLTRRRGSRVTMDRPFTEPTP